MKKKTKPCKSTRYGGFIVLSRQPLRGMPPVYGIAGSQPDEASRTRTGAGSSRDQPQGQDTGQTAEHAGDSAPNKISCLSSISKLNKSKKKGNNDSIKRLTLSGISIQEFFFARKGEFSHLIFYGSERGLFNILHIFVSIL